MKIIKSEEEKFAYTEIDLEVKNEKIYQQFLNDLYEEIEEAKCFNFEFIEANLLRLLLENYNRTQASTITGLCVRTIRNKIKKYGLENVRIN